MQFKELGSLFEKGELATLINGGGLKSNNFKTASSISDMQNITAEMFNKQFRINADGVSEFSKAQIEAKANAIGLTDSLKNEVLAMASDASMTDKLRTGKLTWTKAIDVAGDEIQSVSDALKNSGKISEDWILKIDNAKPEKLKQTLKDCVNDVDGLADSFTSLGEVEKASTSSIGDGLKGMLVSLKAILPVIAAVGTAIAVYKAWDYTQTGFSRAQENFENSLSNYKNTKSEIESLNSELDNTKSRIEELKELQNNGVITFAEEVELEKLQHTNDELERQLEIKTKLAEAQSKIVAENAKAASSKEQSYTENQREKYGTFLGTLKSIGDTIFAPTKQYTDSDGNVTFDTEKHHWKKENNDDTTITSQFTSNIKKLSDAKKELSETEKKLAKNPQDKLQLKNQKEQLKNIEEITSALSNQYDTIQGWVESSTDEYGNALKGSESYVKQWKDAINEYVNMGKTKNEKYLNNLENYFSSSKSGSSMKDYLVSLAKDGKSAEEALEAFRASGMRLKDIGVSENAFVRYFEDIKREAQEADEAVKSVDGTFDGLKKSFESENQGANYDTTMGYYKTAKEMYKNGLVGTDDFKSMAQFGVGYDIAKKLKDNADAYTYASDAYVEAWEQSQALLERWYGNEDELTNMTNVLNDFKDAGLASSLGDNEWTFKNDDGSMKFKTTAEAADKLNTSVSNVELAMSKLEEHGFEFDGIEKSGELLENYKNSLDQIKDVYDSMEDGAQKDRLKKLIEGYDSEYEKFQDDLSGLSEDQIVKIKFEYDLASIQQKIQELKSMAEASGSNQDQAALRVAQEQALGMLEGKTGVTKDSDEGYAQSYAKRTSLTKDMAGKSEEERAAINQEINALLELQNAFQQFKLDGGELDWNSFLDTPTATALFNDLVEKGTLTEKQIKELFGDSITCNIDAKLNDDDLQKKLTSLKTDEKITFKADVDNLDNAQVEAVKNQDGTIKYTANVAGVPKEVHKITEQDGTIRFTTEFDGSLDWINNNLKNGETITYKADVSGIQKDIEACKDENGTIHYYSVMDDGSKQELTQQTDKDGKITYVADTSEVENAVKNTESQNPKVKVELTPDEQRVQDALKSLLNDQTKTTFSVDADFSKVKDDINALEVGHSIVFTANVDGVDQAVAAVKYQDGSIGYIANVDGVYYQLSAVQNTDGTVSYTIGNYPTEVPNANQTIDRTPNNSQVSKSPSSVGQTVNRTPNNSGILHAPTIVQKVIRFFTGGDKLLGTAHASGTLSDSSNLKDSWKTKKDEVALTGEVGEELVVSGNRWFTTGSNGAEFANIPAGSVVFNSKQTKELLSQGFTKSRGKGNPSLPGLPAFLEGTAYASGGRLPSSSSSSKSSSSKKKSSSSSSKSSSNSSSSSSKSNSSSNSSNDKEETKETLDWIETKLDRIKRKIDELDTTASSTYRTWSKRNEALSSELSKVTEKISLQQQAYDRYIKEAESAGEGLSSDWIDKIQNGKIDIETITDSDLKEKISDYKNWYEKALDCRDAIIDLKEQESKLIEQRFNNIKDEYDAILKQFEHTQSMLEGAIDITETSGYIVSTKYYDRLISNENEKINKLYAEREALVNSLNSALSSGKIDKYSESWYNMQDEIDSIDESIQDCNKSTIEWENSIRQIQWDLFDKLQDRISKINDEADFLKELMSSEKMYDDKNGGQITEYGKATFGLHGVKHNTLMAQADEYRKEMEKIDEQLKSDPFNQTLIDRRNELLKLQQESITSAKQEKDAIKDLVEDGINSQLDALQKLIDKYTDLLDTNKDMYDYQKQLAEKQKEISSIEKQLAAYQGDTSEEGASKRQQLQNDLNDAKQDLAETQYERSIADQKKLLDDLYEQYEEVLNMRLDNIDVLVSDVIANVNSEAGAIRDTLEAKADSVGYTMTESMNTIWNSANQVITNYGTNFLSSITGVQNAINDLTNLIKQAVDASNKKASASSSSTKKPSSSTPASQPAKPTPKPATTSSGDGVPNVGDAVTFNSGAYYYSSDGISPTGTQMHGQTVYITKISNASWAKKKYHIAKDRNAAHPLGWVDLSQISGYEKGIKSIPKDEMAIVGEHKKPETIVLDDGSILTPLSKNSSVFNNDAHENLWSFANDPQRFIESMIQNPPEVPNMFNEFTANQTNTVTINIPIENVSDYNDFVRQLQKDSKFEKMVQTMVLEPIAGNSTIGKYKQRF